MKHMVQAAIQETHRKIAEYQGYSLDDEGMALQPGMQGQVYRGRIASRSKARELAESNPSQSISVGQAVVLKFYHEELTTDPSTLDYDRFRNERKITMDNPHRNIVRSYELCEVNAPLDLPRHVFLVMEAAGQQNLREWMEGPVAKSEENVWHLACTLCKAVDFLHSKSVFHRDVKPENIMIRENGEPCLLDLGVATRVDREAIASPSRMFHGTIAYSSWQVITGQEFTASDDIYSVGATLFDVVFFPEIIFSQYRQSLEGKAKDPLVSAAKRSSPFFRGIKLRDGFDRFWMGFLEKALAKERDDRFDSMESMTKELTEFGHGKWCP